VIKKDEQNDDKLMILVSVSAVGGINEYINTIIIPATSTGYMASIRYRISNLHFCGGSIISDRFILTAASCFHTRLKRDLPAQVKVTLGNRNCHTTRCGESYNIKFIHEHPEYDPLFTKKDIAIAITNENIIFHKGVRRIYINGDFDDSLVMKETELITVGYLKRNELETGSNKFIAMGNVLTQTPEYCAYYFRMDEESQICTLTTTVAHKITEKEAGGPLIYEDTLVGVASWTYETLTVFTKISYFVDWLKELQDDYYNGVEDDGIFGPKGG